MKKNFEIIVPNNYLGNVKNFQQSLRENYIGLNIFQMNQHDYQYILASLEWNIPEMKIPNTIFGFYCSTDDKEPIIIFRNCVLNAGKVLSHQQQNILLYSPNLKNFSKCYEVFVNNIIIIDFIFVF